MSAIARSTASESPRSANVGRASSAGAGGSASTIGAWSVGSAAAVVVAINTWSDPDLAQCGPQHEHGFGLSRARPAYPGEMAESQADEQAARRPGRAIGRTKEGQGSAL